MYEYPDNHYRERAGYEVSRMKLQNRVAGHGVQDLVVENARAQEMKERRTSDLAPGAYMMGTILEKNGEKYRSGDGGRFMTTEDYRSLYESRRVSHINETANVYSAKRIDRRNIVDKDSAGTVSGGNNTRGRSTTPNGTVPRSGAPVQKGPVSRTQRSAYDTEPTAFRKAPSVAVGKDTKGQGGAVRRAVGSASEWFPMNETYIKSKSKRRFPVAMVMMIVVVSVSLLLIVCGSVMTSHMERQVSTLNGQLEELQGEAAELEDKLALKNDPVVLRKMATELGMVESEYTDMRMLRVVPEEKSVVYETEESRGLSLSKLLSAMGFLRK